LDPFCGSGTTLIEAINNQRYALGLEIDKEYIKNSLKRIEREWAGSIHEREEEVSNNKSLTIET